MTTLARPTRTQTTREQASSRIRGARAVLEPLVFGIVLSAVFGLLPSGQQYTLTTGLIYALLTASVGILFGWAGISTFGHAAFFGVGAYTLGLLMNKQWTPLAFLAVSGVVAGVAAFLFAMLASRVVRIEFAMLTLVVGQIAYLLTYRIGALKGDDGIYGVPRGTVFGMPIQTTQQFWWYAVGVVVLLLIVLRRIQMSSFGESLNASRDDPIKSASLGLPVKSLRVAAFALAGTMAGIAGALYGQQQGIITPSTLTFAFSGQIIIMALLGGLNRFWGPPIGALVFVELNSFLFSSTSHGELILGLILLVIVVFFRGGLLGITDRLVRLGKAVRG